jgi:hypothetical protein
VKNEEYNFYLLSLSNCEIDPKCVKTNYIYFLHTSGLWHAVIKFIIVHIQQFIVCKSESAVKHVLKSTWIKSSAKFVKYVSPVSLQTVHKLSMILHEWFKKLPDTDNFPTTNFKISKKFVWCKKL